MLRINQLKLPVGTYPGAAEKENYQITADQRT